MPDLPRPMVTTRPLQALIISTTSTKTPSRCSIRPRMAAASTSRTRLASARAGGTSDIGAMVSNGHAALAEDLPHLRFAIGGHLDEMLTERFGKAAVGCMERRPRHGSFAKAFG